ncbi:hypothetical protein STXM2123_5167 [Streptomyces sp. F-3]|nr:hypothetical protein STXM2123_5167 [Streptomyces sp. F-3]
MPFPRHSSPRCHTPCRDTGNGLVRSGGGKGARALTGRGRNPRPVRNRARTCGPCQ